MHMRLSSLLKTLALTMGLMIVALPALADCVSNGETYPEGTRSGPYVCENGQWVLRE
jgi:hypothetical protein